MAWARTADGKLYKNEDGKKVMTADWKNLPTDLWNSTTVIEYLNELNRIKYGAEPIIVGVKRLRTFVKRDLDVYGANVIRAFVREAVRSYKGNKAYPTLNYAQAMFLFGEKLLPSLVQQHKKIEETSQNADQSNEEIDW